MVDVGDTLGNYQIVARLKAGGMATLYLGRRAGAAGFARHVAIKLVHQHLVGDRNFVRMFLDEALLSSKIHHPNVVHVEELGEEKGVYYLVMEYVHGCSLAQVARALARRKRRLSPEMAVHIAIGIADGLHAAHELTGDDGDSMGVVHRDVSPQNVLLSYKGHVKVIDFGIAKARNRASQTTGASLKGKIRYMSPEQAFGRAVDRRTDVYAVGVVLWELLTQRRMFDAENDFALLDMVRNPTPVAPSTYASDVSPALDAAVLHALAPKAEDRSGSCQELRRELARAVPGALAVDASDLSELLQIVMSDQIEKDRKALPDTLSGVFKVEAPEAVRAEDGEEALKTMTIAAADINWIEEDSQIPSLNSGSIPSAVGGPSSKIIYEGTGPGGMPPRRDQSLTAALDPVTREGTAAPPAGNNKALLGVGVLVGVLGLGGGAALYLKSTSAATHTGSTAVAPPPVAPAALPPSVAAPPPPAEPQALAPVPAAPPPAVAAPPPPVAPPTPAEPPAAVVGRNVEPARAGAGRHPRAGTGAVAAAGGTATPPPPPPAAPAASPPPPPPRGASGSGGRARPTMVNGVPIIDDE